VGVSGALLHDTAHVIAKHTAKDNHSISGQTSFHQLTQEPLLHGTASTMCALMESSPFELYIILIKKEGWGGMVWPRAAKPQPLYRGPTA
jgi:hypothetical protein